MKPETETKEVAQETKVAMDALLAEEQRKKAEKAEREAAEAERAELLLAKEGARRIERRHAIAMMLNSTGGLQVRSPSLPSLLTRVSTALCLSVVGL